MARAAQLFLGLLHLVYAQLDPAADSDSYVSQVLLPRTHSGLRQVMEFPFNAIYFSEAEISMGFRGTLTTQALQNWLYHQVPPPPPAPTHTL